MSDSVTYDYSNDKDRQLTLGEVLDFLDKQDPNLVVVNGFAGGHSYRGYNSELAFAPAQHIQVADMERACQNWLLRGKLDGHKGGEYPITSATLCNIADFGQCGTDEEDHLTINKLEAMMRGE